VFGCDDKVAVGVYDAVVEHGLRVPEDVAIVGYANETEPLLNGYAITTVDQQPELMGRDAGSIIMQILAGSRVPRDRVVTVPTSLVARESTLGSKPLPRKLETNETMVVRPPAGFRKR